MIKQPIQARDSQATQPRTMQHHTPKQQVIGAATRATTTHTTDNKAKGQSKRPLTSNHSFDRLITSANSLLSHFKSKQSNMHSKNEQLNALLSVVSSIEKSNEKLQETLASLDGAKVNAEDTVHKLLSVYARTETLVTECELALKDVSEVQELAKESRAQFSNETGDIQRQYTVFEKLIHSSTAQRDELKKMLDEEMRKEKEIERELAEVQSSIEETQRKKEEQTKDIDQCSRTLHSTAEQLASSMKEVESQRVEIETLKRKCSDIHDEVEKILHEQMGIDQETLRLRYSKEKLLRYEDDIRKLLEGPISFDTVQDAVSRSESIMAGISQESNSENSTFDEVIENMKEEVAIILRESEKVREWETKKSVLRDELSNLSEVNTQLKNKCSELQSEHYSIVSIARETELANRDVEKERNSKLKEIESTQNSLVSDMEALNNLKNENFQLEKSLRKIQADMKETVTRLENEQLSCATKKEELHKQLSACIGEKTKITDSIVNLEKNRGLLIEESKSLDEILHSNKERELEHVRQKRTKLDNLKDQLRRQNESLELLLLAKKDEERRLLEVKQQSSSLIVKKRDSVEKELSLFEVELRNGVEKEKRELKASLHKELKKEKELLERTYESAVEQMKQKIEESARIFEERKQSLQIPQTTKRPQKKSAMRSKDQAKDTSLFNSSQSQRKGSDVLVEDFESWFSE